MQRNKTKGNGLRLIVLILTVSLLAIVTGYFFGNFMVDLMHDGKKQKVAATEPADISTDKETPINDPGASVEGGEGQASSTDKSGSTPVVPQTPEGGMASIPQSPPASDPEAIINLQVASASKKVSAEAEVKKLKGLGYNAVIYEGKDGKFKVLVKTQKDKREQIIKALEEIGYSGIFSPRL